MNTLNCVSRVSLNPPPSVAGDRVKKLSHRLPLLAGLTALAFSGLAQGTLLFQHQGSTNPSTEGFTFFTGAPGTYTTGAIANDLGQPVWSITASQLSSQPGYFSGITAAQKAEIASNGFDLEFTARVLLGIAPTYDTTNATIAEVDYATSTRRFDVALGLNSNGDTVVVLPISIDSFGGGVLHGYFRASGSSVTLSGNSYHDYHLSYNPTTQLADLSIDGVVRLQNYAGHTIFPFDAGLAFIATSGGQANFNSISLATGQTNAVAEPSALLLMIAGLGSLLSFCLRNGRRMR